MGSLLLTIVKTNKCTWIGNVRNMASLIGEKVKGKEIMVYNFVLII